MGKKFCVLNVVLACAHVVRPDEQLRSSQVMVSEMNACDLDNYV